MSRDEPLLLDILLAASEAIAFVAGLNQAQFIDSKLHQNAVIRSLEVIGEAATRCLRSSAMRTPRSHGAISLAHGIA
jgi:uncharacterized protein with HEPN domain